MKLYMNSVRYNQKLLLKLVNTGPLSVKSYLQISVQPHLKVTSLPSHFLQMQMNVEQGIAVLYQRCKLVPKANNDFKPEKLNENCSNVVISSTECQAKSLNRRVYKISTFLNKLNIKTQNISLCETSIKIKINQIVNISIQSMKNSNMKCEKTAQIQFPPRGILSNRNIGD